MLARQPVIAADTAMKLKSHSQPAFFGLSDKYLEGVYEEIFFLKQHGNWTFVEAYNIPHRLRQWWIKRLQKHFKDEAEAMKKAQSG